MPLKKVQSSCILQGITPTQKEIKVISHESFVDVPALDDDTDVLSIISCQTNGTGTNSAPRRRSKSNNGVFRRFTLGSQSIENDSFSHVSELSDCSAFNPATSPQNESNMKSIKKRYSTSSFSATGYSSLRGSNIENSISEVCALQSTKSPQDRPPKNKNIPNGGASSVLRENDHGEDISMLLSQIAALRVKLADLETTNEALEYSQRMAEKRVHLANKKCAEAVLEMLKYKEKLDALDGKKCVPSGETEYNDPDADRGIRLSVVLTPLKMVNFLGVNKLVEAALLKNP